MQDEDKKIVVIGLGNMGASLARGLLNHDFPAQHIHLVYRHAAEAEQFALSFPDCSLSTFKDAVRTPASFILALKPKDTLDLCRRIASSMDTAKSLFISVAAGISHQLLQDNLGSAAVIIRSMPNTPAAIGYGMTGLYTNESTVVSYRHKAESILSSVGKTLWLNDESALDAVTALSGSGPAYLFYFMECLQKSGQALGLNNEQSTLLTLEMIHGAAKLALASEASFAELRSNVTSKGGTTEAAINSLSSNDLQRLITEALNSAAERSKEISQSFQ
ncbi:MAG: pyrroline-5-carboxylate reductase [Gammaproteobacteria bacterium]|nr:pyrroline-5-carboxylate reductase [Gammaproteobacteria bacterium]